jgi:RAB6A-GEF complex partner protein 1
VFTNQCTAYSQIQKSTQLFLPFILEGLLRKKLKVDASKIIKGYRYLPYFLHILELLVHKILEEEATASSSEIIDPVLSDVIEFLNQFPEYLQIISHCTRKSEVAVWPYLFGIVGNSRNLFEKCLEQNDLETAASYLVVLQNTESLKVCEDLANMLLRACLKNCVWDLIQEIIRFLTSIDPADLENDIFENNPNPNDSHILNGSASKQDHSFNSKFLKSKNNSVSSNSSLIVSPKKLVKEDSVDSPKNDEVFFKSKQKLSKKTSFNLSEHESLNKKSIESTIYDYGFDLLKSFRIKKLFEMFSNLNGFNIEKWLQQYQSTVLVENFVQALSSLHFDFNWPYPILINELKSSRSFLPAETNGTHNGHHFSSPISPIPKSDFIYENSKEEVRNGSSKNLNVDGTEIGTESFDLNLVAQELANTGSTKSEKELLFIISTFQSVKCYEWIFLLAIILKNFSLLNEIMRQLKSTEIAAGVAQNIRKGLVDLDAWSKNDCCGYRSIIEKINNL